MAIIPNQDVDFYLQIESKLRQEGFGRLPLEKAAENVELLFWLIGLMKQSGWNPEIVKRWFL